MDWMLAAAQVVNQKLQHWKGTELFNGPHKKNNATYIVYWLWTFSFSSFLLNERCFQRLITRSVTVNNCKPFKLIHLYYFNTNMQTTGGRPCSKCIRHILSHLQMSIEVYPNIQYSQLYQISNEHLIFKEIKQN